MNAEFLKRRVRELVSDISDPIVRPHKDEQTGMFVCTRKGMMRAVFWDFGMVLIRKTAEQVANEIASELKT